MTSAQSCLRISFFCFACLALLQTPPIAAAEAAPSNTETQSSLEVSIDKEQRVLADQFTKLEELFIRLSELEGGANPTRANLLQQAAQLSKQLATQQRLSVAVDYLAKGQFTRALQEQEAARENLQKLLELLQRENRGERLRDERQRVENLIKEVQRISRLQRSLRGRTEAGQEIQESADEQQSLQQQTEDVASQLKEVSDPNSTDSKPKESSSPATDAEKSANQPDSDNKNNAEPKPQPEKQPGNQEQNLPTDHSSPTESQPTESENRNRDGKPDQNRSDKPQEGKPADPNSTPDNKSPQESADASTPNNPSNQSDQSEAPQSKPSSQSQPQQGQPQQGQPQQSQPNQSQPNQGQPNQQPSSEPPSSEEQQPPQPAQSQEQRAQDRVQQAQQRMQEAQERLKQDQRQDAVEQQRRAEQELAAAVEELESILRQMREEEIERSLANLESRFRRMLTLQTEILKQTERYASVDGGLDQRQIELQSIKLAIEERKVLIEGQRAMLLLEDEGSSMAFPEAVEQLNGDIALIADLFNKSRMDQSNVGLQQQVVSTLEELLESLTATQKDREKKKEEQKNGQKGGGGGQQEQELVDKLAELRLIRTLQLRINKRTAWLAQQNGTADDPLGQVADPLLTRQARELAERQERLEGVMRDIILQSAQKN